MKHARFATIHLFALLLLALTGGGHTAHATQVCRNIISNDINQTVCRQPNGDWMLVNVPAPEEDAAHEFFDQYGQDFVGLDLSYQAAVKCETRSQAWGDAAEHAISDELNRSISQNVGPLDSPNSQKALSLVRQQIKAAQNKLDDNFTPDKCPGFNQTGGAEAVDEIIREDSQN